MTGKKKEPDTKTAILRAVETPNGKIAIQSEQPVAKVKQTPPPKDD